MSPQSPPPYQPQPLDTSQVVVPDDVQELVEMLARNTHDVWAYQRVSEGWTYGPHRDDARKQHPGLVPYEALSHSEQEYDRRTAMETLKLILALGYRLERRPA